jgi:hypothetical protein
MSDNRPRKEAMKKLTEKTTEDNGDVRTELYADGQKIAKKLTDAEHAHFDERKVDAAMTEKFGTTHAYSWM